MSNTLIYMFRKSKNHSRFFNARGSIIPWDKFLIFFLIYLFNNGIDIAHPASKSGNENDLRSR